MSNLSPAELKLLAYFTLTEAQFDRFRSACNSTYGAISADMGSETLKRAELIELVLDADRVRQFGEYSVRPTEKDWLMFYDETIKPLLEHFGTPKFNALMKIIFPHPTYSD